MPSFLITSCPCDLPFQYRAIVFCAPGRSKAGTKKRRGIKYLAINEDPYVMGLLRMCPKFSYSRRGPTISRAEEDV